MNQIERWELPMIQTPTCVGLVLCEKFVVEENSRNLTLVNSFRRLVADDMPWTAPPFYIYFCLSDGIGDGTLTIEIADAESADVVHDEELDIRFDDPVTQERFVLPIVGCMFEAFGRYESTLAIDGEMVALAVFDVEP